MVCVMTKLASRETSYLQCLVLNYRLRRAQVVLNTRTLNCTLLEAEHYLCMHAYTQHTHTHSTQVLH